MLILILLKLLFQIIQILNMNQRDSWYLIVLIRLYI
nr:MAG TPA: hypothetical protein [Caudoviricetes sp.]